MKTPAANTSDRTPADATAKIAVLTRLFEKLVAESASRRRKIEQLLDELNDDVHTSESDESRGRAA